MSVAQLQQNITTIRERYPCISGYIVADGTNRFTSGSVVLRSGVGRYVIVFDEPQPNTNYVITLTPDNEDSNARYQVKTQLFTLGRGVNSVMVEAKQFNSKSVYKDTAFSYQLLCTLHNVLIGAP